MKIGIGLLSLFACCSVAIANDAPPALSKHLGQTPALVAVVCSGGEHDLSAISGLVENYPWTIICQGAPSDSLDRIRRWAREKRLLGKQVCVIDDDRPSLWLANDMADAVWVLPGVDNPPSQEDILRALHPGGIHITAGKVAAKPADPGVDEWRHPYHAPDNNVVSRDRVASLPGELRFQTRPVFAAMPNQTLFCSGRVFFFTGHIAFHEREEPLLNKLTALNAYNGLPLWSRSLNPNYVVHNFSKLATGDDLVFAEGETLWRLDAATGHQRGEFHVPPEAAAAGDTDWKWIVQEQDILWAAFGPPDGRVAPHRQKRQMGHWPWNIANTYYRVIIENFGAARRLAAFKYPEMDLLWSVTEDDPFDVRALCMEGGRIFTLAPGKYVAARDAKSGAQLWRSSSGTSPHLVDAVGNAIKRQGWGLGWATYCCARVNQGVVCVAGPPFKKSIGIDLEKGELLWTVDGESPHPFFLEDDLYFMPRVAAPAAVCRTVEPRTGKVREEFNLGVIGSCTRLTVTPNQFYYRPGGGEGRTVYFDVTAKELAKYEGIVRPGCFDGVVPANGRLYWLPLACDCWQVHGTFCMAPRTPISVTGSEDASRDWAAPTTAAPAGPGDWPLFRANSAGTATVDIPVSKKMSRSWTRRLPTDGITAPVCVDGRIYVGGSDGTILALEAEDGGTVWQSSTRAAVLYPPGYWNGRVVVGSCDGYLYCLDAADGRVLGNVQMAPEKRFVNIMNQFMSTWAIGGGVVIDNDGTAYAAAGSTAADGCVAAAVDIATGNYRWRETYTLDRKEPGLSFGVQSNILLHSDTLFINGGAPVGIVALDARTGRNLRIAAKLEAGMEMFLEPDGKPFCAGPELHSLEQARTTIFKRHQGRAYFRVSGRYLALVDGRVFCAKSIESLDRIVKWMNSDPNTGGKLAAGPPRDVMKTPTDNDVLWAGESADVCGLAVGTDGMVVLHSDRVEGLAVDGQSLWNVRLPATPVRWGVALTDKHCVVTLTNGEIVCLSQGVVD